MTNLPDLLRPSLATAGRPAYRALADALRALILDGRIVIGEPLPAERSLAETLRLSRTTVTATYTLLRTEGYLVSHRGSGSVAALPAQLVERPDEPAHGPHRSAGPAVDLTIAAMPAPAELATIIGASLTRLPTLLAGHGLHPLGLPDLRTAIARRYTARGLPTGPEQVLVTQGALHGWDLVLRSLTRPGDTVLVEQPTYPAVVDAAAAHNVRAHPLGVSADGWTVTGHRRVRPPALAHVTPDHQNPTGLYADRDQRRELLASLRGTLLVCDETFADLTLDPPEVEPLAALAGGGSRVVSVGSLSKSVWAGLRVGWIRADPQLIQRLAMSRTAQDQSSPVLDQLAAVAVLDGFIGLVADRRAVLTRRRDHLLAALATRAPAWTVVAPRGGMVLWADLGSVSSTRLASAALEHGVRITAGPRFSLSATHDRFLRLPFTLPEATLDRAVDILVAVAGRPGAVPALTGPTWTA